MAMTARERFLRDYPTALIEDAAGIFLGAGVSIGAGYPSWSKLLRDIGKELDVNSGDVQDLAALAQWHISYSGSQTAIKQVIRNEIAANHPIPEALEIVVRLPIKHWWTTNYDRLIERAFEKINRPIDVISGAKDLSIRARPGAARLYKMHGSVDRLDDLVISTDDYELYRLKRAAYVPLLQAHLMNMSMLFVGLSFTDPNVRHVLATIRESFTETPPQHFAIVRPPHKEDFKTDDEYKAKLTQHNHWARDLTRYGLHPIEIDSYDEVPALLNMIERRVARHRVWISGSWPVSGNDQTEKIHRLSASLGHMVGTLGMSLVTGAGLLVGSASISGFLDALRSSGGWDLERRLIARPFPQPLSGRSPDREQWAMLRHELARQAGIAIFVGGVKRAADGSEVLADGVLEEARITEASGTYLLPIGATGGAAQEIAKRLLGSSLKHDGEGAVRPSDNELQSLMDPDGPMEKVLDIVSGILRRIGNA